jgi:glycosyltransferase involved in cell wall biosynthesis
VVGPSPRPTSFAATLTRPEVEHAFREWIRSFRPHVAHFHHLTHLSLGLVRVARECDVLPLMTLHDYWMVCARGQLVDRDLARCAGPTPGRCAWCVGGQLSLGPRTALLRDLVPEPPASARIRVRESLGRLGGARLRAAARDRHLLASAALGRVARFAAPSRDLAERFARLGLDRARIDLVTLPLVHPVRAAPDPGSGPLRLLFVGSLIPTKGVHLLIEAFARLPAGAATLRVIGPQPPTDVDPTYARRLSERVREVPGARLCGPFAPGQVQPVLDEADVLVLPSIWEENSPLVLREARAAGLRIVASRRGGIPEVAPGARLCEPDVDSLLRALLAECARGRGREAAIPSARPEAHAAECLAWYRRCLEQDRPLAARAAETAP